MGSVKVKMSNAGARSIMNSSDVQSDLLRRAQAIKGTAESIGSASFAADVQAGRNRAHAMVKTTDAKSRRSNAKNNALLKSLDAGR